MCIEKVRNIFCDVFNDPHLKISPEMSAKDIAEWDSFNHIKLVVALESAFNVSFTTKELAGMANIDDLIKILQKKGIKVSW